MVNKRSTKHTEISELRDMNDFLSAENQFLKKKNEELAKALSDSRMGNQKLHQDNLELHERLYSSNFERVKCQEYIKAVGNDIESHVKQFIILTEDMTSTLEKAKIFANPDALRHFVNMSNSVETLSNSPHKTMAVMPMVDGHTILSPKINLPRVTVKQLTHMMNSSSNECTSTDNIEADEIEFADNASMSNESNSENNSEHNSDNIDEEMRRRLETMHEEDEENLTTSQPLLSGVFKDVKVYISPLPSQHVIHFKTKRSPPNITKSLNGGINASALTHSRNNTTEDMNSTQRSNQMSPDVSSVTNNSTQMRKEVSQSNVSVSKNTTDLRECDPLEGPSHLLNTLYPDQSSFNCPNQTSTPKVVVNSKSKTDSDSDDSEPLSSSKSKITIRKRQTKTSKSSIMSSCSVKLRKMTIDEMSSYTSSNYSTPRKSSETTLCDREDSPTVLEKSRRSSTNLPLSKRKKRTISEPTYSTSPNKRGRRNVRKVSYAEPKLSTKMRRC